MERIFHSYGELFPTEFEFLVLYHLYINYPSLEMQYTEIKQAIVDTSRLPFLDTGKDRQIERTFKGLLRTFIERAPSKSNQFILTPHAEKIVEIAIHRINNPYLKFPLKDTFEMYFKLPNNATEDISNLQSWFKFGFQNNARQMVTGHLEGLKLSVDDAVKALNRILEADNLSAIQILEQFSANFQILGDKARQITEAIRMKVEVHYQLRDIVEIFAGRVEQEPSAHRYDDLEYYQKMQHNCQTAIRIKEEVNTFFDKVDKQLDVINMKMVFAGSKIKELQETLRVQSHFKLSLKKMLVYLLENSKADQPPQWITLPDSFPRRDWVQQKFRFRTLRYYDLGFLKRTIPFEQKTDEEYEVDQQSQFELELAKQALIQEYFEQAQRDLETAKSIDLSKRIFEITQQENSIEIGVQTGYEFIRNLTEENFIEIKEELQSSNNSLHIWKVTVRNNRNLAS
ncbi:hypothetical protein [Chitinophaga sp.]|uniref:hypothetical protein n=1 Tax=Chitinophaga sp. TaxID=1869181 RepID=UPI0031D5B4E2